MELTELLAGNYCILIALSLHGMSSLCIGVLRLEGFGRL